MSKIIIAEFQTIYKEKFILCSSLTNEYVYDINALSHFCSIVTAHNNGIIDLTQIFKFSKKDDYTNFSKTELCLICQDA